MSAFRDFEKSQERLSAARDAFSAANERIRSFRTQSDQVLERVFKEFASSSLFPNIDPDLNYRIQTPDESIAKDNIWFRGKSLNKSGTTTADDHEAIEVVDAIIEAARKKKLPVVRGETGCQKLEVSEHVKEREKCPEILLLALAEYAQSKGNDKLMLSARLAAETLQKSVAALQELE